MGVASNLSCDCDRLPPVFLGFRERHIHAGEDDEETRPRRVECSAWA